MTKRVKSVKIGVDFFEKSKHYDQLLITTKGFAFDSLVFRFKDYQARAFQSEVVDYKYKYNENKLPVLIVVIDGELEKIVNITKKELFSSSLITAISSLSSDC